MGSSDSDVAALTQRRFQHGTDTGRGTPVQRGHCGYKSSASLQEAQSVKSLTAEESYLTGVRVHSIGL